MHTHKQCAATQAFVKGLLHNSRACIAQTQLHTTTEPDLSAKWQHLQAQVVAAEEQLHSAVSFVECALRRPFADLASQDARTSSWLERGLLLAKHLSNTCLPSAFASVMKSTWKSSTSDQQEHLPFIDTLADLASLMAAHVSSFTMYRRHSRSCKTSLSKHSTSAEGLIQFQRMAKLAEGLYASMCRFVNNSRPLTECYAFESFLGDDHPDGGLREFTVSHKAIGYLKLTIIVGRTASRIQRPHLWSNHAPPGSSTFLSCSVCYREPRFEAKVVGRTQYCVDS